MKSSKTLLISACLGVSMAAGFWLVRHRTPSVSQNVVAQFGFSSGDDVVRLRKIDGLAAGRLSEDDFSFLERAFDSGVHNQIIHAWLPLTSIKDPAQQQRAIDLLRKGASVPHFDIAVDTVLNNYSITNMPLVIRTQSDSNAILAQAAKRVVLASKGRKI